MDKYLVLGRSEPEEHDWTIWESNPGPNGWHSIVLNVEVLVTVLKPSFSLIETKRQLLLMSYIYIYNDTQIQPSFSLEIIPDSLLTTDLTCLSAWTRGCFEANGPSVIHLLKLCTIKQHTLLQQNYLAHKKINGGNEM